MSAGQSETLSAQVTPAGSTDSVIWSSSDDSIASVDQTGKVTAIKRSDTPVTITAAAGNVSADCAVTVTQPVTGVKITDPAEDTDLALGAERTFVWTVSPGNANDSSVTWSSSDTSIATVSPSGVVKGVGEGEATITVTTRDGNFTDSRKVTVACDHQYGTLIPEVPASHSANGTKAHYHCSVCGKYFDESKNEITDFTISNAAHGKPDETNWEKDGTGHWRVCKAVGCSELIESTRAEHTFEWKTDKEPTVNEAGTKHEECTVCGFKRSENTEIDKITYSYTDSGYSWKKRSGKDLSVTIKRNYKDELTAGNFSRLEIDGKTVDGANYSTVAGSVIITLKKSYLESGSVSVGKHTLTAYFSDGGNAETKLTVTSSSSGSTPGTGDDTKSNDLVSGMILFIVSLSFVAYSLYANKLTRANLLEAFSGASEAAGMSGAQADVQEDGFEDIIPEEPAEEEHLGDSFDDIIPDEPADDGFDDIIE